MDSNLIRALGVFLAYYESDLEYIRGFQNFVLGNTQDFKYIEKEKGSFYSFLIEFRVARNFSKGSISKLLGETVSWIEGSNPNDVDLFAQKLASTNLTGGKIMTSLASKILFLNNPWELLPMDQLARRTLNQRENRYAVYKSNLTKYVHDNDTCLNTCLDHASSFASHIESKYPELQNIELIRKNRILDKILWSYGKL